MSSAYNHVRHKKGVIEQGMEKFIREEVDYQEQLEAVRGEGLFSSGGKRGDRRCSYGMVWMKRGESCARTSSTHEKIGWCGVERDRSRETAHQGSSNKRAKPSSMGRRW